MRLLVVVSRNPFPPRTGSSIVAYNCMKYLSKSHSLSLVCLQSAKDSVEVPGFAESAEFVYHRQVPRSVRIWQRRFDKLAGIPSSVSDVQSKAMIVKVREAIERGNFDAILLFEMNAIQYCPPSWYHKIVVNIEDPPSIKLSRITELPIWSSWQRLNLSLVAQITRHYEKQHLPGMGKVILLSEADMQDMQEQGGYDNLGVVSYGIDKTPENTILGYESRTEGMIVYSGNMFHPPNVDGALYFLENIFPVVLQEYSTATLWIVGTDPDMRIRKKATRFGEHVVITGRVDQVSGYLRRARVSICPVRLKIGCQTKILEALSCGTPVVTTSAGNSGIQGSSGKELWVEDEPIAFAGRVVALLRGENWRGLSEEGRRLVEARFSWERSGMALEQHLRGVQKAIE
jgi:polysaccharide biosynthesis protein PslH